MKKLKHLSTILFTVFILPFSLKAQDASSDRWQDSGNNTNLQLPVFGQTNITVTGGTKFPNGNTMEVPLKINVSDANASFFSILNGTQIDSNFQPVVRGHYGNDYNWNSSTGGGSGLFLMSTILSDLDYAGSNTTMMSFDVRRASGNTLSTSDSKVQNIDLFRWRNLGDVLMLMNKQGYLGINETNPQARLHVDGSVRLENLATGTGTNVLVTDASGNVYEESISNLSMEDYDWYLSSNGSQTTSFPATNSDDIFTLGRVGIGGAASLSETPSGATNPMPITLTVYGNAYASGGQWTSSDQRYKENISAITRSPKAVLGALNGYSYNFKKDAKLKFPEQKQYGLLAQEIEEVLPEAVSNLILEGNEIKAVNYQMIIPFLVEGYKEQQQQIEKLSDELQELKALLNDVNTSSMHISNAVRTSDITVYPNPSDGLINFDLRNGDFNGSELRVYSLDGKLIKNLGSVNSQVIAVNLEGESSGLYTVVILKNAQIVASQKFILE